MILRLAMMAVVAPACFAEQDSLHLVIGRKAAAVVIVPDDVPALQSEAVGDFVDAIEKSTNARLPVVSVSEAPSVSDDLVRLVVGPSALTEKLGYDGDDLKLDEFGIHTVGNDLIILARDLDSVEPPNNIWGNLPSESARTSQWALGYLLDRYVGVRWLWPGELGTFVPKHEDVSIPRLDVRFQQPLVDREFNVIADNPENLRWLGYHHFGGHRADYRVQHGFKEGAMNGDWWADFRETRPDMLAQNPDGEPEVRGRPTFFKICISNPDTADEVIRRWKAAGMPDFWDMSPNDGNGFCSCDGCRALDRKYGGVEYTREEVWNRPDHVSLTDRYVWFWNRIISRMREMNPHARIGVFLYGAFRVPPKNLKVKPGVFGLMVRDFDFSGWKAWQEAGVEEIGLRPNWLYMGASGPHLNFADIGTYIEQARATGMTVIRMDCFHEYWATQGPIYYMIGRLVSRPDLGYEQIIDEYCSAFGRASSAIRAYLDYWEDYHRRVIYTIPAGGSMRVDPNGIYGQVCLENFGEILHPLRGHWQTLPYVYNDAVMSKARELLDKADAATSDGTARRRIDFLRDGLRAVDLAAAYMSARKDDDQPGMQAAVDRLAAFGEEMAAKHGYWHYKDLFFLKYWGLIGEAYEMSPGM